MQAKPSSLGISKQTKDRRSVPRKTISFLYRFLQQIWSVLFLLALMVVTKPLLAFHLVANIEIMSYIL